MNLGDPERARRAKQSQKERERQAREDLRQVLATPAGRRYAYRLLERCGIHGSPYRQTPRETDMQLGLHLFGLRLRDEIEAVEPGLYGEMRSQFNREERGDGRDTDSDGDGAPE